MSSPEVHSNGNFPSAHAEAQLTHQQIREARLAGLRALSGAGVVSLRSRDAQRLESDIVAGMSPSDSANQITGEHPVVHADVQFEGAEQQIPVQHPDRLN